MSENKSDVTLPEDVKSIVAERKKKKLIKILIIVVAAVLVIAAVWLTLYLTLAVRPISRTKEQKQVVGKVGEFDVYRDELDYLVALYKSDLEHKYGYIDWNGGSEFAQLCIEELEKTVRKEITTLYATLTLCKQKGIEIDGRELDKAVNEKVKAIIDSDFGGEYKKYKEWLSEIGMSDAYYRLILKVGILDERLFDTMIAEGTEIEYSEKNYKEFIEFAKTGGELVRTTHVYYPKEYLYKEVDVDESRAICIAIAEHLKSIKSNSERYEKLNDYISKCPYLVGGITMSTLDGVYYFPTTMGEQYEGAVEGLDEYGVSDMLETDDGFYVVMKLPLDAEYIGRNGITLLKTYQSSVLFRALNATEDGLSFDGDLASHIKDVLLG